ncbi:MAG TPA: hypothetical protein VHA37_01770 [Candidatus Saccharimonadales bacterium]|nr:hypothetical protein [Candidatus Saccharimonadales bacterium]
MSTSYPFLTLARKLGISYRTVLKCAELIESGNRQLCAQYLGNDLRMVTDIYAAVVNENVRRAEAAAEFQRPIRNIQSA